MGRHYHASQIGMAGRCMAQFEYRYIRGIKRPPNFNMLGGTGTHGAIAPDLISKRDTGKQLPLEQIKDLARDVTMSAYEETFDYSDGPDLVTAEEKDKGRAQVLAETVDKAVVLASLHYDKLTPQIDPAKVEHEWTMDLQGSDISMAGTLDLQLSDIGKEGPGRIIDIKTTTRKPDKAWADISTQLTMYSAAMWEAPDGPIPPVGFHHLIYKKQPEPYCQYAERTRRDIQLLINRIVAIDKAIKAGNFPPTNEQNWYCRPERCGYLGHECEYR